MSRYVGWAEQRHAQLEEARRKFPLGSRIRFKRTNITGVVVAHPPTAANARGNYGWFGVRLDGVESPDNPDDTNESVHFIAPEAFELVEPSD